MGPDRDRSLDLKSDTHLQPDASPTALRGPAHLKTEVRNEKSVDYLQSSKNLGLWPINSNSVSPATGSIKEYHLGV